MPNLNRLLHHSYRLGTDLVGFEINRQLKELFPGRAILATEDYDFDLVGFAEDGRCMLITLEDLDPLLFAHWLGRGKGVQFYAEHAFLEILWNGQKLMVLTVKNDHNRLCFLISERPETAQRFFEAVCVWSTESAGRIIVFDGCFHRDPALEESVQTASWDSLVLPQDAKTRLNRDVCGFFQAKETYDRYGMPWKRGVLLHGPPGNGKTHAIKALVKESAKPTLVVRSLKQERRTDESAISRIFARARQMAPTILLFEDIDSLVARSSLGALLNELDGVASNNGLLCIATTNHLDKLDTALSNRPSRFDRKYLFPNPKAAERLRLLQERFNRLDPEMRPSEIALANASRGIKGFSGAMLQELVGACAMTWLAAEGKDAINEILKSEIERLTPQRLASKSSDM